MRSKSNHKTFKVSIRTARRTNNIGLKVNFTVYGTLQKNNTP